MRSRILVGAAAWLLGAATATAGSLLAVEQLGQGIGEQPSTELSVTAVNARLAAEQGDPGTPAAVPSRSGTPTPLSSRTSRPTRPKPPRHKKPKQTTVTGRLIPSQDGTAYAECRAAGASLAWWTPQNGFEADHVVQGPAAVASVTFRGSAGGVVMKVTCQGGVPVAHLSSFGGWHDE